MVFISGMLLGMFMGGGFCSFILLNGKKESMGALADIQKSMLESNYESESETERVLTIEEKLAAFNIKDTTEWELTITDHARSYLLAEYVKGNDIVPYSKKVMEREYLYPTMLFEINLTDSGEIYYNPEINTYRNDFYFKIPKSELKKLKDNVTSDYYDLKLEGGHYRVLDEFTNEYTEFDESFKASILLPLDAFSDTFKEDN